MVTIKEIAREANVSPTTVSLILNNKSKERKISAQTEQLKSISRQPQPRPDSRQILGCQGLIPQLANSVGKKDLLRRAHGEAPDAGDEFVQILPPLLQLIRHGFIAYNGSFASHFNSSMV